MPKFDPAVWPPQLIWLTITFIAVTDERTTTPAYAERYGGALPFDYLWFTARANDRDYCGELRKRWKKSGADRKGR